MHILLISKKLVYYFLFFIYCLRYALCVMRYALCVMRYALCVMRYALCVMNHSFRLHYDSNVMCVAARRTRL
jgi:hypothetical protein